VPDLPLNLVQRNDNRAVARIAASSKEPDPPLPHRRWSDDFIGSAIAACFFSHPHAKMGCTNTTVRLRQTE
jgi:hypothetical protein